MRCICDEKWEKVKNNERCCVMQKVKDTVSEVNTDKVKESEVTNGREKRCIMKCIYDEK